MGGSIIILFHQGVTLGGLEELNQFYFNTKLDQTLLLGQKARNIAGLADGVRTVPDASVYFHTHRFLHQHHFLSPEPPNDFAYWIGEVLNERELGEMMSSVDIVQFHTLRELRDRFLEILGNYRGGERKATVAPEGQEFHFMCSRTFVLRTPYVAEDLAQFKEILKLISINSIYYHVFDAKLRLQKPGNELGKQCSGVAISIFRSRWKRSGNFSSV